MSQPSSDLHRRTRSWYGVPQSDAARSARATRATDAGAPDPAAAVRAAADPEHSRPRSTPGL